MVDNTITAESCCILSRPSVLRMELLPENLRKIAIQKLIAVAERNNMSRYDQNPDTRNPALFNVILSNVTYGYIDFLTNMLPPDNVEEERGNLIKFLKGFELLRNNSILDYAPEFKDFLESYGY
jgi:hypothetical protein